ncbi:MULTISPECIES: asparagine synthetase B family protein [Lysinibacillus]|uniref:asparagine synthetase B family protein n=1 Tax=Lysinibacillus TaxID=400634 RepID=UPI00257B5967|nr:MULTISPECIES: asparagine synthase-related protein [Lysinibacillus]
MSGISGIYYKENRMPDREEILRMVKNNISRGNDYIDLLIDNHIGMGFNALNITPESKLEKQPLEKDGIFIVADIRLDRREDLVGMLNTKGLKASITDSDVLLLWKFYKVWGVSFPKLLYGEFAFVIWDSNIKQLICGKDFLGQKPLFYKWNGEKFIFSSMLEGLLNSTNINTWNKEYFIEFIANQGFVTSEKTPYKDIMKLPAAHTLVIRNGKLELLKYWDIQNINDTKYKNEFEYYENFRELFFQAVKDCMRSDYPVSVAMSGGLDSTSIFSSGCTLNPTISGKDFFPVSVVFDRNPSEDERDYIRLVCEKYKKSTHEILGDELWSFKGFPNDAPITSEPYVNIATYNTQKSIYSKANAEGAKVILTGAGGDEVLSGSNLIIADYIWKFQWKDAIKDVKKLAEIREEPFFKNLIHYGIFPLFKRNKPTINSWLSYEVNSYMQENKIKRGKLVRDKEEKLINNILTPFMDQYIAAPLGMEARHPFLDKKLIEFLVSIPTNQKIQGSIKKIILKRSLDNIVPNRILSRYDKTTHFSIIYKGLQNEWSEMSKALKNGYLAELGLVNHSDFVKDLHLWKQGGTNNTDFMWTIVSLELWFYRREIRMPTLTYLR